MNTGLNTVKEEILDISRLIQKLSSEHWPTRKNAAEEIIEINQRIEDASEKMVDTLLNAFSEHNEDIKYWVAVVLGKLKSPTVVKKLVDEMQNADESKCFWISRALSESCRDNVDLVVPLFTWSNFRADYYILESVKEYASEAMIPVLCRMIGSEDERIRHLAIETSARYDDRRIIDALLTGIGNGDWYTREKIFDSIEKIDRRLSFNKEKRLFVLEGILSKIPAEAKNSILARIINSIKDFEILFEEARYENCYFSYLLIKISENLGSSAQVTALLNHSDVQMRYLALRVLEKTGDSSCIPVIMDRIFDTDEQVVFLALKVMRGISTDFSHYSDPGQFLKLFEQSGRNLKLFLIEFLGDLGNEIFGETIAGFLSNTDDKIRFSAAVSLGKIKNYDSSQRLAVCFQDKYWPVRRAAAMSMARLGEQALPVLETLMENGSENEKFWASSALSQIEGNDEKILPILLSGLNSEYSSVKNNIIKNLSRYTQHEVAEVLTEIIQGSESDEEKLLALKSLRRQPLETILDILKECIDSKSSNMQQWALKILAQHSDSEEVRKIIEQYGSSMISDE